MSKFLIFFALFAVVFCQYDEEYDPPVNDEPPVINNRPSQSNLPCPIGWRHLAEYGKCLLPTPAKIGWREAEDYCTKLGGNLMSFHGIDELLLAAKMVFGDFWVGLYKYSDKEVATWRFTNNETLHYIVWGNEGSDYCAHASGAGYLYGDQPCENPLAGICQVYATS